MSGRLIRRSAGTVLRVGTKRQRLAYGAARYAYSNRKQIGRAARTIGRAYKRYKRKSSNRAKSTIGESVGTSSAKRHKSVKQSGNYYTRELYSHALFNIPRNSGIENDISLRDRDIVNLRGVKFCLQFTNKLQLGDACAVNWAVIQRKGCVGEGPEVEKTSFFRSEGDAGIRHLDFSDTLSQIQFACLPINTDKYKVFMHKRFRLEGSSGANQLLQSKDIMHYWKVGRQLRFENQSFSSPESKQCYLVWWADALGTLPGTARQIGINRDTNVVCYFRDPK